MKTAVGFIESIARSYQPDLLHAPAGTARARYVGYRKLADRTGRPLVSFRYRHFPGSLGFACQDAEAR